MASTTQKNLTWTAFKSMVKRDLVIQWRDKGEFVFRVAMLPFVLILLYGYVLPNIGVLDRSFPDQMFPGMVGMSLLVTGIHGTAIPLSMDFNNTRAIEDRLLAPVDVRVIAASKMFVGILEAWIGALIVLPISLLFMGSNLNIQMEWSDVPLFILILVLAAVMSASLGLLVGTIVKPSQIAAMFPGFLMPLVFTGGVFFTWESLSPIPWFQYLVLINPLLYVNEALRFVMTPQLPSFPIWVSLLGMVVMTLIMGYFGIRRFIKMTTGEIN
ncbi:ABC transporter permease [Fundicoccus culcitae]|uniref:Transport permease protein n=1 Tax=Fundicoccus culcitae TaxID=2969821 RepID=A0ABY5P3X8_9LACT|nr:ABC transporter permease [Fundicoccus culcitae]UUX33443.1 ABC transporter permease [Fundicoccus culcitae]